MGKLEDLQKAETNNKNLWLEQAWLNVSEKVSRNCERIGAGFPHVSVNGRYNSENVGWWTNGFWPGILWLVYRETKNKLLSDTAMEVELKLDEILYDVERQDHDLGFRWMLTSVAQTTILGNDISRKRALMAANLLAARFNVHGNFIRAFNEPGREGIVIIDTLMNLPLLYWASEITADPRFKWIAIAHTDTVLKEFLRSDGSVHHAIEFNAESGERVKAHAGQGYKPESSWSRGASWAIHGLALAHRYTGKPEYLEGAKKAAHYFLAALPDDMIPYWDFRAPLEENMPMDTSAAACAASGLIELGNLVENEEKHLYHTKGCRLLQAIYQSYKGSDNDEEGILLMGTGNYPAKKHINVPLIYGDYFFIESLTKLRGFEGLF